MGTDVWSKIWVGARLPREELFVNGDDIHGCPTHGKMEGKCCSECGKKLVTVTLQVPTPLLEDISSRSGVGPVECWQNLSGLMEGTGLEAIHGEGEYRYPGPNGPPPYADIGLSITTTDSHRGGGDGRSKFDPADLVLAETKIKEVLERIGLGHLEVGCYVITEVSC